MKKNILILSALFLTTLSVAGTKEDFEGAIKNFSTNRNVRVLEGELKKISAKKSDTYTRRAKLELSRIYIQNNNLAEGKKYLKEIVSDKDAEKELLLVSYSELYNVESNVNEKIKSLEKLIELNSNEESYKLLLIKDYRLAGNDKKADEIYNKLSDGLKADEKLELDKLLAISYSEQNLEKEADKLIDKLSKSKDNASKATAEEIQAIIALNKKRYDDSLKHAQNILKYTGKSDRRVNGLIYQIYILKGDKQGGLKHLTEYNKENLDIDATLETIVLAEDLGNTKLAEDTYKKFKSLLDEKSKKDVNVAIADRALQRNVNPNILAKYAKKAVEEDKNALANELVAIAYANLNNKAEALKAIDLAIKAGSSTAKETKANIEKLK